jgi:hypothetical protein
MVEPVTATLAAMAVGYLAPYLAEAGKEGAKKLGGAAADGAVRLLGFLRDKLRGTEGEKALAEVEAQPGDTLNQAVLQRHLRDRLAADPALREELRALVEALPQPTAEQRMAIQGNQSVGVQAAGSGINVNVGRR